MSETRFVRIRGRIVPIKTKSGSGSRKPKKVRAAKSQAAKDASKKVKSGVGAFFGGQAMGMIGAKIFDSGKSDARAAIKNAAIALKGNSRAHADTAVKLFKKQKIKHTAGKIMALAGVASTVYGFAKVMRNSRIVKKESAKRSSRTKALRRNL